MQRLIRRALVVLAAWATLPAPSAAQPPAATGVRAEPIEIGECLTVQSTVLGDERQINIWTPADYDSPGNADRRYNVLYLLDGGLDQDFQHIAGLAQLGALSGTYETLIVVGVETKDRRAELTRKPHAARFAAEFPQAGGAERFINFLADEVIPLVETRYRHGERRALMGESLAGLFVIDTFLHRPDLFQDFIAISPSLWWDDQHFARHGGRELENRAVCNQRLYLTIANEGGATQAGMERFLRLLDAAPRGSITWRHVDRSASATHSTIYHPAALDALRWLYPLPESEDGPIPWYYLDEAKHAADR